MLQGWLLDMRPMRRRSLLATLAVAGAAASVFAWGTDGYSAFTAESARRLAVLRNPRPLPRVQMQDQDGRAFALDALAGQPLAIEFIYTRCQTICRALGASFQQILQARPAKGPGSRLQLLSISFDPQNDHPEALRAWAQQHGADGRQWRVARPVNAADMQALLSAFGVIVIPDGLGGFEHNAAIHLLDAGGRLVRISDMEAPAEFFAALERLT